MDALSLYVIIAALVCGVVSFVELLDRYSHSAEVPTVIWNGPAAIYLTINCAVGALAVIVGSSTGSIALVTSNIEVISLLKSALVGAAALAILRSNIATLSGGGEHEMALGPSAILDKIKEYLDRRIDLLHKLSVDEDIALIMKDVDALKARVDLPALCLTGVKRCTESEVEDMTTTIDDLLKLETMPVTRGMMMGHALYNLFGLQVLRMSVKRLGSTIHLNASMPIIPELEQNGLLMELNAAKLKLMGKG